MALVDRAAGWLTRACEPYAALEPRFWTVPPAYHVQELCFCLLVAVAAAALSRSGSRSISMPPRRSAGRTSLETGLGALLLLWLPVNVCNKLAVQGMPPSRALVEMCLPCHVYTAVTALCLLAASPAARPALRSLLLYCSWMPLLAMAFPDLEEARALGVGRPLAGRLSEAVFWVHHLCIFFSAVCICRWGGGPGSGRLVEQRVRSAAAARSFLLYVGAMYADFFPHAV